MAGERRARLAHLSETGLMAGLLSVWIIFAGSNARHCVNILAKEHSLIGSAV